MFAEAGDRHNIPHFHDRYGEHRATFAIATSDLLAGSLPNSQLRLVQAWIEIFREQLEDDWQLLSAGRSPKKISPLA